LTLGWIVIYGVENSANRTVIFIMKTSYENDFESRISRKSRLRLFGLGIVLFVVLLGMRCCSLRERLRPGLPNAA
jgi:hypothetical protein